jgi:hypothetical protein
MDNTDLLALGIGHVQWMSVARFCAQNKKRIWASRRRINLSSRKPTPVSTRMIAKKNIAA